MKYRVKEAGLWCGEEGSEITISTAWSALSRLGQPSRYLGRAQDGSHEYGIIDPLTGDLLATGKGVTLEKAMCQAALNARTLLDISREGSLLPDTGHGISQASDVLRN